jgi:adenine-specific DNA-methyltransferase
MAKSGKAKGDTNSAGTVENGSSSGSEARQVLQGGPEPFDLRSHTVAEERKGELLRLFPEARAEGEKLDFNRLRLALGDSVDVGKERYGLSWPGKADCFRAIQTPSLGTLLPAAAESVNWDSTENMIIEGDNLEVLKLLQKSYLGKVKMIYIDPPYNTGNDFIYPDNYAESLQTYLEYTGQVDSQGKKFSTNSDTEGRFHSKWLNMMYPRLYLARNLLRQDGLLFASCDDNEAAPLRLVLSEVFGEDNFVAAIAWEKRYTRSNNAKLFYSVKDTVLAYRKSEAVSNLREPRTEKANSIYANPDADPRGPWTSSSYVAPTTKAERPGLTYPIARPDGKKIEHPTHSWKYAPETYAAHLADKRIWWGKGGQGDYPRLKVFLSENDEGLVPIDLWDHEATGTTDEGGQEIKALFGSALFDTAKPTKLIKRMLRLATGLTKEDVVLDFFAGSGTTAQAVLEANREDNGNRRFVLVQLPEPTPTDSEARKAGYLSISALCEERVRRAIKAAKEDSGFRVYKLGESNFKVWDSARPEHPDDLQRRLTDHIHHIREGRSEQDILTELLLKSGIPPTTGVSEVSVGGKKAYKVAEGHLVVCLDRKLTLEAIRAIADLKPERVVCLDEGFEGDDQLKVNAAQTFKTKGVASFQTV